MSQINIKLDTGNEFKNATQLSKANMLGALSNTDISNLPPDYQTAGKWFQIAENSGMLVVDDKAYGHDGASNSWIEMGGVVSDISTQPSQEDTNNTNSMNNSISIAVASYCDAKTEYHNAYNGKPSIMVVAEQGQELNDVNQANDTMIGVATDFVANNDLPDIINFYKEVDSKDPKTNDLNHNWIGKMAVNLPGTQKVENFGNTNDVSYLIDPKHNDKLFGIIDYVRVSKGWEPLTDNQKQAFLNGASGNGSALRDCEIGHLTYTKIWDMMVMPTFNF